MSDCSEMCLNHSGFQRKANFDVRQMWTENVDFLSGVTLYVVIIVCWGENRPTDVKQKLEWLTGLHPYDKTNKSDMQSFQSVLRLTKPSWNTSKPRCTVLPLTEFSVQHQPLHINYIGFTQTHTLTHPEADNGTSAHVHSPQQPSFFLPSSSSFPP